MMAHRRWLPIAALFVFMAPALSGQGLALTPAQAGSTDDPLPSSEPTTLGPVFARHGYLFLPSRPFLKRVNRPQRDARRAKSRSRRPPSDYCVGAL